MSRLAFLALLAAACSPSAPDRRQDEAPALREAAPPAASTPPILPADATAVNDVSAIQGEWRVAGVSGQSLSQPFGISASIQDNRVRFVSQCITRQYELNVEGGLVAARPLGNDVPDCARALTIDERGLEQAMSQAKTIYRLPSNALVLDGPAGAVTLFTQ
jgi:hypothetical protein